MWFVDTWQKCSGKGRGGRGRGGKGVPISGWTVIGHNWKFKLEVGTR